MNLIAVKPLMIFLFAFALGASFADDFEVVKDFCDRADREFQALLASRDEGRRVYWRQQAEKGKEGIFAKQQELQQTSEMLGRQPDGKELKAVFAFKYLNDLNEIQLTTKTKVLEDLGREIFTERVKTGLTPLIDHLERQFISLRKKHMGERIQAAYASFLEQKRAVLNIGENLPVKERYVFQPKAGPFDSKPEKVITFEIHDWPAAFMKIDELTKQVQPIQDTVDSALFFQPRDPHPWVTGAAQLIFLMVSIGGWIKSYHGDSYRVIGVLVGSSMLLSIILIFYSDITILNIACQGLAQGVFIIYWIVRSRSQKHKLQSDTN